MTGALLDKTMRDSLQQKAASIGELVGESADELPLSNESRAKRNERRLAWYHRIENGVLDLTNSFPAGTEDYEAKQLFVFLLELRRAIDEDPGGTDSAGSLALAAAKMLDVLHRMKRRLERSALDNPDEAASFVLAQMSALKATDVARVLGVTTKTLAAWKTGTSVKNTPERAKLVAQLVAYLRYAMTPTGLLMWFENPADALNGRSPLELLNDDVSAAWEPLITYARGGRGQLAS